MKIVISTAYTRKSFKVIWVGTHIQHVKDRKNDRSHITKYSYKSNIVSGQDSVNALFLSNLFRAQCAKNSKPGSAFSPHIAIDRLTISDIRRSARNLKTRSSPEPDLIPPSLVKDCISVLEIPLLHLCSTALKVSHYLQAWKVTQVKPIYKNY